MICIIFSGVLAGHWQHFRMWRLKRNFETIRLEEAKLETDLKSLANEIFIVDACKGGKLGIRRVLDEALLDNNKLKSSLKLINRSCYFIESRLKSKLRLSRRVYWEKRKEDFFNIRKELKAAIKKADIAIETAELIFFHNKK
jgi:hypothetical protein